VLGADNDVRETLWIRDGFPDGFLARTDKASAIWRENFIHTYLERDIPQLGPRVPAETLRRFSTMLAHNPERHDERGASCPRPWRLWQDGCPFDLLVDLLLVRRLPRLHANVDKCFVKPPKVYVRDSGIVHAPLGLHNRDAVLDHPVAGGSWEGFDRGSKFDAA
jgi:predicted AAA+ superfamily ATPase